MYNDEYVIRRVSEIRDFELLSEHQTINIKANCKHLLSKYAFWKHVTFKELNPFSLTLDVAIRLCNLTVQI